MCALTLTGCAEKISFENGSLKANASKVKLVVNADEFALLDNFTRLSVLDVSGSTCYEEITAWKVLHPETEVIYNVTLPDGRVLETDTESVDLSDVDAKISGECLRLMKFLPKLEKITLGELDGRFAADDVRAFNTEKPEVELEGTLAMLGKRYDIHTDSFDLSKIGVGQVEEVTEALPYFLWLENVDLGSEDINELSFDDVAAIEDAAPDTLFSYYFTLFGREFDVNTKKVNLSQVKMDDNGERVRAALRCMKKCDYLDMDSCGVDNEHMAAIRDENPDVEVVWRVNFGYNYSVRTNVDTILASDGLNGGQLNNDTSQNLMYCTKVKYLDIGHNVDLTDISFVKYMPDLEVFILCQSFFIEDISPLSYCSKLEYIELIACEQLKDLSPLSELHELKHLNIGCLYELEDISPLYGLTQLERLWITRFDQKVPPEQIAEMRKRVPGCTVNDTTFDPSDGGWRYLSIDPQKGNVLSPEYIRIREIFRYSDAPLCYSFSENDPYYSKPAPTPQ